MSEHVKVSLHSAIENLCVCPICAEEFEDPRQLSCGHTFCLKCLERWSQERANQQGRRIVCPSCKGITALNHDQGVQALRKDFTINQILSAFQGACTTTNSSSQQNISGEEEKNCEFCKSIESEYYCQTCQKRLCSACDKQHQKNKLFKGHRTIKQRAQKPRHSVSMSCDNHDGETVKFFCLTCDKTLCDICAMDPTHNEHHTTTLKEGLEHCRTSLSSLLDPLNTRKEELTFLKQDAEAATLELKSNLIRSKEILERTTDELVAQVQQWETEMQQKLKTTHDEATELCKSYTDTLQMEIDEIGNLTKSLKKLNDESSTISIITGSQNILTKFKQINERELPDYLQLQASRFPDIKNNPDIVRFLKESCPLQEKHRTISNYDDVVIKPPEGNSSHAEGSTQVKTSSLQWSITRRSSNTGDIMSPISVSFTPNEQLLVSEYDSSRVQIFDKMGNAVGNIDNIFPKDAVTDKNGSIYVADSNSNEILIFGNSGEPISRWGIGRLKSPRSLAIAKNGDIVVVDKETCKVTVHTIKGALKHTTTNRLLCPVSVCVDSKDRIIVADRELNQVVIYDKTCKFMDTLSPAVLHTTVGTHLQNVCVDNEDNIYMCMHMESCILKYSPRGEYIKTVLSAEDGISWPTGVAVQTDGYVAVVESKLSKQHSALKLYKLP